MEVSEARERLAGARVARLATVDAAGRPHIVPICFALEADTIYNAVDHKPKRTTQLRRLSNVAANPCVAVLADHYEDGDWAALWWVRDRYAPYRDSPPEGPVLAVDVDRWTGWRGDRG